MINKINEMYESRTRQVFQGFQVLGLVIHCLVLVSFGSIDISEKGLTITNIISDFPLLT